MKTLDLIRFFLMTLLITGVFTGMRAQTKFTGKEHINFNVSGTSTMHDWVMKSSLGDCTATFVLDDKGNLKDVTAMNLTVSSKVLKSGKGAMDKNAYKALKADKNPNITAVLKSAEVTTKDNKSYTVKSMIKLTIAGKTLDTELISQVKRINDNSFSVKGEKKISMKDYGMEPPSFMLGAVTTGNDVVLNFDLVLNQ